MATQYKWTFPAFDAYPQSEGEKDVIFTIHYTYTADDGAGHVGSVYGTVGVTYQAGEPFTPFAQLTEPQVQAWVETALGEETVAAMKLNVDGQIENQINPKIVTLPPPWVTTEVAPAA